MEALLKNIQAPLWSDPNKKDALNNTNESGKQRDLLTSLYRVELSSYEEFNKKDIQVLIDYIINTHHNYAKENAIVFYDIAQSVANKHGERHPELLVLLSAAFLFLHDLLNNMVKEEAILFPGIKLLAANKKDLESITEDPFNLIRKSISLIQNQHDESTQFLMQFRKLSNNYALPKDACDNYRDLYEKMKEFEADLVIHFHVERKYLIPRANIALQKRYYST